MPTGATLLIAVCAVIAAATAAAADKTAKEIPAMQLSSPAFAHGAEIPSKYTCEGADVSPPLSWTRVPPNAKSLALIVDDPDAPDPAAPKRVWSHWVVYNIPPTMTGLAEAMKKLPDGMREGLHDGALPGYGGPCPPIGRHRYFFRLYALDVALTELYRAPKGQLDAAMKGHIIGQAELMGTYQKKKK